MSNKDLSHVCNFCEKRIKKGRCIPRDQEVFVTLTERGYRILRFWEHEINKSPKYCINVIKKVMTLETNKERDTRILSPLQIVAPIQPGSTPI